MGGARRNYHGSCVVGLRDLAPPAPPMTRCQKADQPDRRLAEALSRSSRSSVRPRAPERVRRGAQSCLPVRGVPERWSVVDPRREPPTLSAANVYRTVNLPSHRPLSGQSHPNRPDARPTARGSRTGFETRLGVDSRSRAIQALVTALLFRGDRLLRRAHRATSRT